MIAPERERDLGSGDPRDEALPGPLAVIWPLLGRHIAFHRRLVDITSNVKAALLLSQTVYWTRHGRDIAQRGGWFHKTTEQWALETGLSVKQQVSARELLRALALLEDQRMGIPARLHFRLNLDELGRRLADRVDGRLLASQGTDLQDRMVIAELLGPSVAFHRALAGVAGGVHAGLLLSRALYLTRLQARRQRDQWISGSVARWFDELGLSRREQEAARRDLLLAGLWEERVSGIPPSLIARVRLEALLAMLTAGPAGVGQPTAATAEPDRGIAADSLSSKGETRLRESHTHVLPKPSSLSRPKRHDCSAESATSLLKNSTGDSVQPQNIRMTGESPGLVVGCDGLIFPDRLLPVEREAALRLLSPVLEQRQALLDELAGRLHTQRVRSPVAYLRGLIQRAAIGQFIPELAPRVAAERDQREREAEARRAREMEEQRLAAERATPEYKARERERRERIGAHLRDLRQRWGSDHRR